MDNIKDRLKTASDATIKAYDDWFEVQKDAAKRTDLQEAIHELRKSVSRIEIDIAVSERGQGTQKPLPIPSHKSFSKDNTESILGGNDTNEGNGNGGKPARKGGGQKPRPRRKPQQKAD